MLDTGHTEPRIYVACLASYNNGIMHGRWIDASADVDEMQEQVDEILRASPCPNVTVEHPETGEEVRSAEEFAIHDFDGLPSTLGEYCGLQAVADYTEFIEAVEEAAGADAADLAHAMVENWHSVDQASTEIDNFAGIFSTFREYADEAADELIACHTADGTAPQMLINYFDYESYARDLAHDMTVLDMPSGVAIFHA